MKKLLLFALLAFLVAGNPSRAQSAGTRGDTVLYSSAALQIRKISDRVVMHTSFLKTDGFGKVPCNGMIVFDGNEAVVFDTPADRRSTRELLRFLEHRKMRVRAVVSTHFHADCVAGLKEFQKNKIPTFAGNETIAILKSAPGSFGIPETGFEHSRSFPVGGTEVLAGYFGAGHTRDNIVAFFADEQVLFGGCLIKELGASKGNLEDASVADWANTVKKIRSQFPGIRLVIPGHGKPGDIQLLDYTISLFSR